jgi:hypothetical protein
MARERTDHYRNPVDIEVKDGRGNGPDHAMGMETVWYIRDHRGNAPTRTCAIHFPDYFLFYIAEKINEVVAMRRAQAEALAKDVLIEYGNLKETD